jgi:hypothetical protein
MTLVFDVSLVFQRALFGASFALVNKFYDVCRFG